MPFVWAKKLNSKELPSIKIIFVENLFFSGIIFRAEQWLFSGFAGTRFQTRNCNVVVVQLLRFKVFVATSRNFLLGLEIPSVIRWSRTCRNDFCSLAILWNGSFNLSFKKVSLIAGQLCVQLFLLFCFVAVNGNFSFWKASCLIKKMK